MTSSRETVLRRRPKIMQSNEFKKELQEIAEILNQFKSEAVQLKVLDMLTGQLSFQPAARKAKRHTRKDRPGAEHDKPPRSSLSQKETPRISPSRLSGGGAHSIILRLLEEAFFDKPQSISSITTHASERLGHRLKANECSPALLRLLRSGKLTRSKNSDGQYEYTKA